MSESLVFPGAARQGQDALRLRLAALAAARHAEVAALPAALVTTHARRFARIVAGLFGLGGAYVLAVAILSHWSRITVILLVALLGMVPAYLLSYLYGRRRPARLVTRLGRDAGDLQARVARLERLSPHPEWLRRTDRLEPWSVALPLAALSLLLPLTIL